MPAGARQSPQDEVRDALLLPGIPAYPRLGRKLRDRPVTPEVAGSSPVAPALNTPLYGDYDSLAQGGAVPLFTSAMQGFTVG